MVKVEGKIIKYMRQYPHQKGINVVFGAEMPLFRIVDSRNKLITKFTLGKLFTTAS